MAIINPEWLAAWEIYCREGSIKAGARKAGLDRTVFRRRCRKFQAATAMPKPAPAKRIKQVTPQQKAAWKAWRDHGTIDAAAASLNVHPKAFYGRIRRYRIARGLPSNAKPTGWVQGSKASPEWTTPGSIEQRLDMLLVQLEKAKERGDAAEITALKVTIHRLEIEEYGWGVDQ